MKWINLERPRKMEWDKETKSNDFGRFSIEPFEKGFGITLGNALRRTMLSYIQGTGLVGVRIDGVAHEFTSINNLKEDVLDVVMNLKKMRVRYTGENLKMVSFTAKGPAQIYARDFDNLDSEIEVMNKDLYICELSEGGVLSLDLYYDHGLGYKPAEEHAYEDMPVDFIAVDTVYTPVVNVKYEVDHALVGKSVDYDKLTMEIKTDGSITPETVLKRSVRLIKQYLDAFEMDSDNVEYPMEEPKDDNTDLKNILSKSVEELELSVRAANCLKNAGIKTIGELVQKSEAEMLKYRNFGKKSLEEIKELLIEMNLSFGMELNDIMDS
ncbi:MAG TPA: DNA-directed RNA polymerase subunit alpha [Desulfobacteraceae bacterium]|nr:DNA-directed RNA polymerase subunit alpha [Desulfobacteraceae bacterium]